MSLNLNELCSLPAPLLQRREALGLEPGGGDPYLESLPSDCTPEEGGEQEPAELRAARERLAAFTASRQQQGEELPGQRTAGQCIAQAATQTLLLWLCVCGLLLARPLSPCPMPAAGLAEADVQAVLEESRANQAALLGDSCSQPSAAFTPRSSRSGGAGFVAENSCPNSSSTGFGSAAGAGTDTAVHAAPTELPAAPPASPPAELPAAEVPEARVTVRIRDSSSCAAASAAAAGGCAEAEQLPAAAAAASTNLQGAPELVAPTEGGSSSVKGSSPPEAAADSDAEGSASLAGLSEHDDEEAEECLDELD